MGKKEKNAGMMLDAGQVTDGESTELATTGDEGSMVPADPRAQALAEMSDKEQIAELEKLLDCSPAEIEAIATGRLPFWPAHAGLVIHGTIVGQRVVPTVYGEAKLYTLQLKRPSIAMTLDGEIFELGIGENISVLERTVLKELEYREGQEVGILCAGKKKGKGKFDYWDYKVVGVRRTPDQVQAAAQLAMARLQSRAALPAATNQKG